MKSCSRSILGTSGADWLRWSYYHTTTTISRYHHYCRLQAQHVALGSTTAIDVQQCQYEVVAHLEQRAVALHAAVQAAALLGDVDEADVLVDVFPHLCIVRVGRAIVLPRLERAGAMMGIVLWGWCVEGIEASGESQGEAVQGCVWQVAHLEGAVERGLDVRAADEVGEEEILRGCRARVSGA